MLLITLKFFLKRNISKKNYVFTDVILSESKITEHLVVDKQ